MENKTRTHWDRVRLAVQNSEIEVDEAVEELVDVVGVKLDSLDLWLTGGGVIAVRGTRVGK